MGLLPEVDEDKSIENAKEILSNYRRLSRMAGQKLTDIQSPTFDGMPKASSYDNRIETKIVDHIDAEAIINNCQQAMSIMNKTSYWVLYYTYFCEPALTHYQIAAKVGYAAGSIDKLKLRGLLEFAEAYPGEKLLVFKNNDL